MGGTNCAEREWGEFLMANYLTTDTDLTAVANAIRLKGGTSEQLSFPSGFVQAISDISAGGSGGDVNITQDANGFIVLDSLAPGGGSAGVGGLTKYYTGSVTPSSSAELVITHNLGILPKYVSILINSASGDNNTVDAFTCDQVIGVSASGTATKAGYAVILNETGTLNATAYLTTSSIVIRRTTSGRTFSTSVSYTVTVYG